MPVSVKNNTKPVHLHHITGRPYVQKPNEATSHLVALYTELHSQSSQPITGGVNASNSTDPKGRSYLSPASHPRPLYARPPLAGSTLTYGSVPEDGDFSRFRLRHISFWLPHPVLGLYRNLLPDGIQIQGAQRFDIQTPPRPRQRRLRCALCGLFLRPTGGKKLLCYFRSHRESMEYLQMYNNCVTPLRDVMN